MATANMQQDKVLVEGWWLKKAGKGSKSLVDRTKAKHRYFILTERYLDWYEKPGYPRKGTLPLDGIYVRKHGDNVSLVIGQFGGKEFKLTSEGKDPAGRINDWYDRLTNQMRADGGVKAKAMKKKRKHDVCKQRNQHGADRKTVVNQGFGDMPDKAQVVATGQMTITQQPPPQTTLQVTQTPPAVIGQPSLQTTITPISQPMLNMNPMMTVAAPAPMMAPPVVAAPMMMAPTATVITPAVNTFNPVHTTTAIGPFGQTTTYTSAPTPAPVTSTTTYGPFGAQTTYTSVPQPAPVTRTTTYSPFGTTVTQTAAPPSAIMTCMACRAQYQAPMGGLVRCPFCQFVAGSASPMISPMATVTQVGYAPAPFY